MRNKLLYSGLSLLVIVMIAIFLYNNKWTKYYDVTLESVKYQLGTTDSSLIGSDKIHIKGNMTTSWSGFKSFKGILEVRDESLPTFIESKEVTILFGKNGYGIVTYDYIENQVSHMFPYGIAFMNNDISKVIIAPYSIDSITDTKAWSGHDGIIIAAPALDYNAGKKIELELMKDYFK